MTAVFEFQAFFDAAFLKPWLIWAPCTSKGDKALLPFKISLPLWCTSGTGCPFLDVQPRWDQVMTATIGKN